MVQFLQQVAEDVMNTSERGGNKRERQCDKVENLKQIINATLQIRKSIRIFSIDSTSY